MKKGFFFLGLFLISIVILTDYVGRFGENRISKGVFFFSGTIQTLSVNFKETVKETIYRVYSLLEAQKNNKKLVKENLRLMTKNQSWEELYRENQDLKKTLKFHQKQNAKWIPAEVIASDLLAQKHMLIINKGSTQGIKKHMAVIHPKGVVGYIFRTSLFSSQVITLYNPLSTIIAINQRARTRGLVENHGSHHLVFKHFGLINSQTAQKNDVIITEESEQFPKGLKIGMIESIKKGSTSTENIIYIQASVAFNSINTVFVIPQNSIKKVHDVK